MTNDWEPRIKEIRGITTQPWFCLLRDLFTGIALKQTRTQTCKRTNMQKEKFHTGGKESTLHSGPFACFSSKAGLQICWCVTRVLVTVSRLCCIEPLWAN